MIYFTLSTLGLSVEVLVQLQRTESHVVPELRILPQDTQWDLLKALERFIILIAPEQGQPIVEYDLMALLWGSSSQVLIWVNFSILLYIGVVKILIVWFIQEFDGFRKVVNGHIVFLQLHVDYAQVIEVVLWMCLVALLVDKIISGDFILSFQRLAVLMGLKRFPARDSIFLINPKSFDAFMNSITLNKRPCFQMCQHPKMLSNCWKIDFFFEWD